MELAALSQFSYRSIAIYAKVIIKKLSDTSITLLVACPGNLLSDVETRALVLELTQGFGSFAPVDMMPFHHG